MKIAKCVTLIVSVATLTAAQVWAQSPPPPPEPIPTQGCCSDLLVASGAYVDRPDTQANWQGGSEYCTHKAHNYSITADATLDLACQPTGSPGGFNQTLIYDITQPVDGNNYGLTLTSTAQGGTILYPSGQVPSLCSDPGCVDEIQIVFNSATNTYLVTQPASDMVSSTGPTWRRRR